MIKSIPGGAKRVHIQPCTRADSLAPSVANVIRLEAAVGTPTLFCKLKDFRIHLFSHHFRFQYINVCLNKKHLWKEVELLPRSKSKHSGSAARKESMKTFYPVNSSLTCVSPLNILIMNINAPKIKLKIKNSASE